MNKYILASSNNNKVLEIQSKLPNLNLISLSQLGYHQEIIESGLTLEENALIKSKIIFEKYHLPTISDDTGLEVKCLNGAPGVLSARYAGKHGDAEANINKLLKKLKGARNRDAQFRTVICLKTNLQELFFEGFVAGRIATDYIGKRGFGYDPIFIPHGYNKTFAEMSLKEKNTISHRSMAVEKLAIFLKK